MDIMNLVMAKLVMLMIGANKGFLRYTIANLIMETPNQTPIVHGRNNITCI